MKKAGITLHPEFKIGEISGRLFGAFLEPIGSMVNGSMYNPKHPEADEQGLRKDFYEALKETGLPAVRLPGGNVEGFHRPERTAENPSGYGVVPVYSQRRGP